MARAPRDYVSTLIPRTLENILQTVGPDLYCVIDEAQVAAHLWPNAFRSSVSESHSRPVLWEIIRVWEAVRSVGGFRFIKTGTGISIQPVKDTMASAVAKVKKWVQFCDTGGFNEDSEIFRYMRTYVPSHILETTSGKQLLGRIAHWLRGRYRFTTAYVRLLLQNGFRSPHRLLNCYVHHFTGYWASDGEELWKNEPDIPQKTIALLRRLNPIYSFKSLNSNAHLISQAHLIVFRYLTRRVPFVPTDIQLVEIGFSRFVRGSTLIDEHISILSLAQWLESKEEFKLEDFLTHTLQLNDKSRGSPFEDAVSYYLFRAFKREVPLTDIFEFHGVKVPEWTTQGAELVTFRLDKDGNRQWGAANPSSQEPSAASSAIVQSCSTWEEVLEWLRDNEGVPICHPDPHMRPDHLACLRLASGKMIFLAVQSRCRDTTSRGELIQAVDSVTPASFYSSSEPLSSAPRKMVLAKLNELPDKVEGPGKHPVMRVIVGWPSEAQITQNDANHDAHVLATLNMEKFLESIKTGILPALGRKLQKEVEIAGQKRRLDEGEHENESESRGGRWAR